MSEERQEGSSIPDSDVSDEAFIDPDEPIAGASGGGGVPEDAFIDPDEPIVRSEARLDDAFIDPDEPIVRTHPPEKPEDFEEVVKGSGGEGEEEVVVTGIGDDTHLEDFKKIEKYGDPHVVELVEKVSYLADQLRHKGEAGLRTEPGMTRFEASLRAYCTGYLTGKRQGESGS